ncbi:hypothetical protein [Agreia sp. Leaf244]|uniref:hypothetical protein n=1 Tax=Agreia sp. Leaf244 TaxID=1736305 RepID=UPI000B326267|nr:hypothetical protein [Agreia sp. Leaf244]
MTATTPKAPRAALATKAITPVMADYAAWIKAQTGYDVDPMSVQLAGTMRTYFQQSEGNQKRISDAAAAKAKEVAARAARKAERDAARAAKLAAKPVEAKPAPARKAPVKKAAPAKPKAPTTKAAV